MATPWLVVRLPAEAQEGDPAGREPGEPLWPEKVGKEALAQLKGADPLVWASLWQQESASYEGAWFDRTWIADKTYRKLDPNLLNRYMVVDPALSKSSRGNYTAIFVFGVGEDHNYYWLYMHRDRMDPTERADTIFRLHRRFKPLKVGYEQYGLLSDIHHLREQMERVNYRFDIVELGKDGPWRALSKPDRIRTLVPMFRQGRFYFPTSQIITLANGAKADIVKIFLDQEYAKYSPTANTDDMLDVMARMFDPELEVEFPATQIEVAELDSYRPRNLTWMSA